MLDKNEKEGLDNKRIGDKKTTFNKIKKDILELIKVVSIAVICAFIITNFIIVNAVVPTGSMKNTIMPKDRLIAFRLSYIFSEPERDDIVVFKYPDDEKVLFVKRIIGLPGDTVNIVDGKVYINDEANPLPDNYVTTEEMIGSFGPYKVPEGHYFMLGDNRNDSKDSRYWQNTFLDKDKILGKVIFKYYPRIKVF